MAGTIDNTSDQSLLDKINQANSTKTARGTTIVKANADMDKNSFLKILSAELSNQDPQNAQDGTQYVAQMAQFSELEQMANLNSTMRLSGANSLIGKQVTLKKLDQNGNFYSGQVKNVIKDGDTIEVNVAVGKEKDSNGNLVDNIQKFDMDDVTNIENANDTSNSVDTSAKV